MYFDGLDSEGDGAVFGEHGGNHVDDDVACKSTMIATVNTRYTHSLVLSVAVVSMKMFLVLPATIFESFS